MKQLASNYKVIFKYISIIALVGYFVYGYNRVPVLEESVVANWAQFENQYQRRADLIPSLLAVVKAYAKHERETLESVVNARASAVQIKLSINDLNSPEMLQKFDAAQSSIACVFFAKIHSAKVKANFSATASNAHVAHKF